ncbi:MAG: hypothetical protein R3B99_31595 [Polyangiales bacterium]
MGTLNVAAPLERTGENDSPIPSIEPSALGRLKALGVTALFASPVGKGRGLDVLWKRGRFFVGCRGLVADAVAQVLLELRLERFGRV